MPQVSRLVVGNAMLALWRIEESEEELKAFINADSFPVLSKTKDRVRRLEWLATRCCLKVLGLNDSIMYTQNGRPYLSKSKHHISVTHSFPYVAMLSSLPFYVGLDIESVHRPFRRIARKFLTLGELEWVDPEYTRLMAIIWSAKEAMYKLPDMLGFNSFTDFVVQPFDPVEDQGVFNMFVRMGPLVQKFSVSYGFFGDFVITWVACSPQHMRWKELLEPSLE